MDDNSITERYKELGLALSSQRENSEKTLVKTASFVGITPEELLQFEHGEKSPSLPQLEALAYFFKVPLSSVLEPAHNDESVKIDPSRISLLLGLRDKIIAANIKRARVSKGMSIDELAAEIALDAPMIDAYENASSPIPQPVLEQLCQFFGIEMSSLFSSISSPVPAQKESEGIEPPIASQNSIPEEMLEFVSNPSNMPYLELAKKLSQMDAAKIRAIAEGLLEITY